VGESVEQGDLGAHVARLQAEVAALRAAPGRDRRPLTLAEAAERLGVSRARTLRPAIAAGKIAAVPWGKKRVRIAMDEIERLEREGFGGKKLPRTRRQRQKDPAQFPADFDAGLARLRARRLSDIVG